jgi:cytochrome c oxidase subunit 3
MTIEQLSATLPPARPHSSHEAPAWWGMVALITTEATLFVLMLFSYFYLRWQAPSWPPQGIPLPSFHLIIPATVVLLTSSLPVIWAESGIKRGRQSQLRFGLLLAWLMGGCFMGLELWEWFVDIPFRPQTSQYGSLFFTITGLHLAHLSVALAMSAYIQIRAWAGHFDTQHTLAVENVSLYWHFVDVVWIFVFCTVYISPYIK